jgi:tetratricopeptide (TPR) repeat protein
MIWAQQKFALVIGNANYTDQNVLEKTLNDMEDMAEALNDLGFTVEKLPDGDLGKMESAIMRLRNRLSVSENSYGFLYYSGHGLQYSGVNYLIPVNASLPSPSAIRERAVSVNWMLEELNNTGNELNIVVLDACRSNPFSFYKDSSQGLAEIRRNYDNCITMFATSAGDVAMEMKRDRNGVFTTHLLNNLKTPGLTVSEIFRRTGRDVRDASSRTQIPAVYGQFFDEVYLSEPVAPLEGQLTAQQTAKIFYDRGLDFYYDYDNDTAIIYFTEAIRLDPDYLDAYFKRGSAFYEKGDYDRAIADYNQLIRIDPNYALAYFYRGNMYYYKKDYDQAIEDFTHAIRIDPNYIEAYNNRGVAYHEKDDYYRAIADFTQLIRIDPNYRDAYNNRGIIYYQNNDYDNAIEDFTQMIRIDPNDADSYFNRGLSYSNKSDWNRAIADFEAALMIDPNHIKAKANLEEALKAREL